MLAVEGHTEGGGTSHAKKMEFVININDYNNYGHWQQLIYTEDPIEKQK